jgi:DNA polymerase type B, organellar and viral
LKNETIKYCEKDCVLLYQILKKFNQIIFDKFNVDALKYPTISSLAFAIFRTNYLETHKIPLITGDMYRELKSNYTGGACDVYKPYSFAKKIYTYDVNSLYPYVMKKQMMPVNSPTYFEGDIFKINKNPFGFFQVEITAPDNLYTPLLQVRIKNKSVKKTLAPLGK